MGSNRHSTASQDFSSALLEPLHNDDLQQRNPAWVCEREEQEPRRNRNRDDMAPLRGAVPVRRTFRRHAMYTHPETENREPFIREVTKGLIILGGYRDTEAPIRVVRPVWQKELLMERLTAHIETINGLIEGHSQRLRAKTSFGRKLVKFLLFKPPPQNAARFEDASVRCTSPDPFDHLKTPRPLISDHLPLSQQYYRHLFDMVDHVPALNEEAKSAISRGFAQAQVLEGGMDH
ncbi:hypothetical protein CJU89_0050 [Yarrowia sp. B02]|nr:hypothetical protein CJU89_0050 [Yarrowia sp. B02]